MALDRQTQEQYIRVIHRLWPTMQHYTADDVNEEVARIVFTCIQDIDRASQDIAVIHEFAKKLRDFLTAKTWLDLAKEIVDAFMNVADALEENRRYRIVILTAALKYRSMVEIALMDI